MNQANLLQQMRKMQAEMTKAQEELAATVVTGTAGGGSVKVELGCDHRMRSISIDPQAIDPDDPQMLEDAVVAAVNDALKKVEEETQSKMGRVTGGLKIPGM